MEMRYGKKIVIADRNYPSASMAQRLIRLDVHKVVDIFGCHFKIVSTGYICWKASFIDVCCKTDKYKLEIWK